MSDLEACIKAFDDWCNQEFGFVPKNNDDVWNAWHAAWNHRAAEPEYIPAMSHADEAMEASGFERSHQGEAMPNKTNKASAEASTNHQPDECREVFEKQWGCTPAYTGRDWQVFKAGWEARSPKRELVDEKPYVKMTIDELNLLTNRPYWLCCGSIEYRAHLRGCIEAVTGHPERCRFGTSDEHSVWQKSNQIEDGKANG